MKTIEMISEGVNYNAGNLGELNAISEYEFAVTPEFKVPGKVFLSETLKCTGSEISFTSVPAHSGGDFLHIHKTHEEVYIVLKGTGEFKVDDAIFQIKEGSVVRISPAAKRAWRNTGDSEMLMVCIQSTAGCTPAGISDGQILADEVNW